MSEVDALALVELAVFLTLARFLALGAVLAGLELAIGRMWSLASDNGQVVVASFVVFY